MNFTVDSFLQRVDQIGTTFVQNAYQLLAQALTGAGGGGVNVAALLLTLYVIFWGFGLWFGTARGGPLEAAFRLFRVFVIYTMATSWSDFQVFAYAFFNETPSAIGNAMLGAVANANNTGLGVNLTSVNAVQTALTNVWNTTLNLASAFTQNAGYLSAGPYIFAGIMVVAVALLIAYAVFVIALAKLFMWLLLALGPIFILLLLFGFTSQFFSGWIRTIVLYFVVQVLIYAFLAFFLALSQQYFDAAAGVASNQTATFGNVGPIIIVALIGFFLLMQIPTVAANIVGGFALGIPSTRRGWSNASAAASRIAGGAGATRDGLQRYMGRLTTTELSQGRTVGRRMLAQRSYLDTAEARQIQSQLSRREQSRAPGSR
jgi:type IV secretion system protein VirB6